MTSQFLLNGQCGPEEFGGKAANLSRLSRAGFEVPAWTAIGTGVFDTYRKATGLGARIDAALAEVSADNADEVAAAIRAAFAATALDPASRAAVVDAYAEVAGGAIAVRSSAVGEDSTGLSYAGQYDSFLNVVGVDAVADRVRACWASTYSARSLTYRLLHDLPGQETGMAVILQRFVPAEVSGVLFTANVLSGRRDEMLISAVYGLGEGLVSGAVDADTVTVDRTSGAVTDVVVGEKRERITRAAGAGCRTERVEPGRRAALALTTAQIHLLRATGERIEELYGAPQDVEWAFADDRLYVLQARPITALPGGEGAGDDVRVWDNSNIIESYGEITAPLTFSFAREMYGRVYREYCSLLGVPRSQLALMEPDFASMLGYFDGRVYYNVLNWIKVIGLLPGYRLHRRILAAAMGVPETPVERAHRPRPLQYGSRLVTAGARARIAVTFGWYCLTVKPSVARFLRRFEAVYREVDAVDYARLPAAEVYRRFTQVERTLLAQWGRMAVLDNVIMLSYGVLYALTSRWLPDAPEWFRWHVVKVGADVGSTLPARRLIELARDLRRRPELAAAIRERPAREAYDWLRVAPGPSAARLRDGLDRYLHEFGYRSANELKLEEPDLREDPTLLMSMLRDALEVGDEPGPAVTEDADAYLDAHLRGPRRWVYERARRSVRAVLRERERVRFARTRAFGMARRMLTAIGADLARTGALSQARDVFFLRLEELRGAFTGTIDHRELRPLAQLRRDQQDRQRRLPAPPPRFVTTGGTYWGQRRADAATVDGAEAGDVLRGTPSSPGVATGEARVLDRPGDAGANIVVTYRTDPGWVGVLASATALLIERGSPLTHVAIAARELGVPTVVQIPRLTDRVATGTRLTVDGAAGTVTIHAEEA
ncbi:phosphoenolpyruvate synthase [Planosporangium flavigriseum]|uniref:Phosphoenolpyruvate synthase n=1 Tax=Planosporangium flavigriseum TaxID=373681 RepID=A0A8J3LP48_9ACTN|nr:phosphoenolpyruvate synthase [Planosporangium flavigriseum]NJC65468.1 phosphoenolpyruvate synthase [Planosporangium flavigriseum]GIG76688.1 phosphoenolpyruvate synthase [Planosporangium flavigriseum]